MQKEYTTSKYILNHYLSLLKLMLKKRDGATTYIPGVFIQADILREVHVKIEGS